MKGIKKLGAVSLALALVLNSFGLMVNAESDPSDQPKDTPFVKAHSQDMPFMGWSSYDQQYTMGQAIGFRKQR